MGIIRNLNICRIRLKITQKLHKVLGTQNNKDGALQRTNPQPMGRSIAPQLSDPKSAAAKRSSDVQNSPKREVATVNGSAKMELHATKNKHCHVH
jgi:hypothetical protein